MRANMPTIPDFNGRSWKEGRTNLELMVSILDGKGTMMPAFRGRISDGQARDLAAFVRAFGRAPVVPSKAPASEFEQRFQTLQEQWNELQRQFQELSRPPRKP